MPAKSKKQQRFFGIVHKCQKTGSKKGICASKKIKKAISSISDKDAKDFASTSHEGLPEKVEETKNIDKFITFKEWREKLEENRVRTGLKFGYPDGYYRSQYPPSYSTPTSATAALDLEIEKMAPMGKESPDGIPKVIKNPKGMVSFPESTGFKYWINLEEKNMSNKECKCECNSCKHGDCRNCTCKNCKCENCTCC